MKNVLSVLVFLTTVVNVVLFIFWLSLVHVEMSGKDQARYIYDNTSTNITILQVVFALVLMGTALMAIFWYHSVKDGAITNAHKLIDNYLRENGHALVKQYIKDSTKAD